MKRLISIILMAMPVFSGIAKTTSIQGNAFYYRGQTIEIHQYLDLFTFRSMAVASSEIPNDGNFKFTLDIPDTSLYLIKIGKINAHLFIEPGNEYTLVIPEPQEMDRFNPAKDVFVLPEIFESEGRLNQHITDLERHLNRFFIDHPHLITGGGIKTAADSMVATTAQIFGQVNSRFFRSYYHFRMAEFEITTGHSRDHVFARYFENRPLAFDQLSFANAFLLFYNDYMHPKSLKKYSDSLEVALNNLHFSEAVALLSTDKFLQRSDMLDLVFATELYLLGRENKYPLSVIVPLLDSIGVRTQLPEIKRISTNAREILMHLAPGTPAPDFEFSDVAGNLSRLSEFAGRYIYIQFFDRFTPETLRQMSLMKVLKDGYGADIAMFSISTGESVKRLREMSEKQDFDWFFGTAAAPDKLREDYDLRAMPAYFFIDENLKLVKSPAPPPGERIERAFAQIWNERHPNKNLPFKLQPPEVEEKPAGQTPDP